MNVFNFGFSILFVKVCIDLVMISIYVSEVHHMYIKQTQPGLSLINLTCLSIFGIAQYIFYSDMYHPALPCIIINIITATTISTIVICVSIKVSCLSVSSKLENKKGAIDTVILSPLSWENQMDMGIDILIRKSKRQKLNVLLGGILFLIANILIMYSIHTIIGGSELSSNGKCKTVLNSSFSYFCLAVMTVRSVFHLSHSEKHNDVFLVSRRLLWKFIGLFLYFGFCAVNQYLTRIQIGILGSTSLLVLNSLFISCITILPVAMNMLISKPRIMFRFHYAWNDYELRKRMYAICRPAFVVQYLYFITDTEPESLNAYTQRDLRRLATKYFNADSPYYIELEYFLVWHIMHEQVEKQSLEKIRQAITAILTAEILPFLNK